MSGRPQTLLMLLGGILTAWSTPVAAEPPGAASTPDRVRALGSFNRLIRRFDFEESEQAPRQMPINFYRYLAPDQGFPSFGEMHPTHDHAATGRWSFGFTLDTGSMAARLPTSVIQVLPLSDYAVTASVRTEGLTSARARVVAWLHDTHGQMIRQSMTYSELFKTNGRWAQTTVHIDGDYPQAADLVVELQLVQPRQYAGAALKLDQPLLEDVNGQAWFDDVAIWHRPRIELGTTSSTNVVFRDQSPQLQISVRDLARSGLTGALEVRDVRDQLVFVDTFPIEQGANRRIIDLSSFPCGWYRATMRLTDDGIEAGHRIADFAILPGGAQNRQSSRNTLGLVLSEDGAKPAHLPDSGELIKQLGVGRITLPIITEATSPIELTGEQATSALRAVADELLFRQIELTFQPQRVVDLTDADDFYAEALQEILIAFGLSAPRWRVPAEPGQMESLTDAALADRLDSFAQSLEGFVPNPLTELSWSLAHEIDPTAPVHSVLVQVPTYTRPQAIVDVATAWDGVAREISVLFDTLPAERFTSADQVLDLMLRSLYAWRAGFERQTIVSPWIWRGQQRAQLMPTPALTVWHTLRQQLTGRRVAEELTIAAGVQCWLLTGPQTGQAALVAWSEAAAASEAKISMLLAHNPVQIIDAFGNRRTAPINNGVHEIQLDSMPIFITGIDENLARFRAGFGITPPFIVARRQIHEHAIQISNPWDIPISGSLRLSAPDHWRAAPRRHEFSIRPHETIELPLNMTSDPGVSIGHVPFHANIELLADRDYEFEITTHLEVGLRELALNAYWQVYRNPDTGSVDLVVTQHITNRGDRPMSLDAYVSGPGISRQRRPIAGLHPGDTAIRVFKIEDGGSILAGRQLRAGIIERDGNARLNRVLEIPALVDHEEVIVNAEDQSSSEDHPD